MTATDDVRVRSVPTVVGSTLALAPQTPGAPGPAPLDDPRVWRAGLSRLARAGFDEVDLVDGWLRFADLSETGRADLREVLDATGVRLRGANVARCSLIDPERGEQHLEYTLRAVDAAAAMEVPLLCLGFHPRLGPEYDDVWFWEIPPPVDDRSEATWALAAGRLRTVCDHARNLGVEISVELYEDSLVCTGADARRIVTEVGATNLGVNPDLGNTYRSARPQREPWLDTLRGALPVTNLWHLKNYARWSATAAGPFTVIPTTLATGGVDYRLAVAEALAAGFAGPFVVEHYGGDALAMQMTARDHLVALFDDLIDPHDGSVR